MSNSHTDVSTNFIRSAASKWSLAGDSQLLQHLDSQTSNAISATQRVTGALDELLREVELAAVSCETVSSKLLSVANSQFCENRVYDEDISAPSISAPNKKVADRLVNANSKEAKEKREQEYVESIRKALQIGVNMLGTHFAKVEYKQDSDEEIDPSFEPEPFYEPKDFYANRNLPFVIGTKHFYASDSLGLIDDTSKRKNSDDENEASKFVVKSSILANAVSSEEDDANVQSVAKAQLKNQQEARNIAEAADENSEPYRSFNQQENKYDEPSDEDDLFEVAVPKPAVAPRQTAARRTDSLTEKTGVETDFEKPSNNVVVASRQATKPDETTITKETKPQAKLSGPPKPSFERSLEPPAPPPVNDSDEDSDTDSLFGPSRSFSRRKRPPVMPDTSVATPGGKSKAPSVHDKQRTRPSDLLRGPGGSSGLFDSDSEDDGLFSGIISRQPATNSSLYVPTMNQQRAMPALHPTSPPPLHGASSGGQKASSVPKSVVNVQPTTVAPPVAAVRSRASTVTQEPTRSEEGRVANVGVTVKSNPIQNAGEATANLPPPVPASKSMFNDSSSDEDDIFQIIKKPLAVDRSAVTVQPAPVGAMMKTAELPSAQKSGLVDEDADLSSSILPPPRRAPVVSTANTADFDQTVAGKSKSTVNDASPLSTSTDTPRTEGNEAGAPAAASSPPSKNADVPSSTVPARRFGGVSMFGASDPSKILGAKLFAQRVQTNLNDEASASAVSDLDKAESQPDDKLIQAVKSRARIPANSRRPPSRNVASRSQTAAAKPPSAGGESAEPSLVPIKEGLPAHPAKISNSDSHSNAPPSTAAVVVPAAVASSVLISQAREPPPLDVLGDSPTHEDADLFDVQATEKRRVHFLASSSSESDNDVNNPDDLFASPGTHFPPKSEKPKTSGFDDSSFEVASAQATFEASVSLPAILATKPPPGASQQNTAPASDVMVASVESLLPSKRADPEASTALPESSRSNPPAAKAIGKSLAAKGLFADDDSDDDIFAVAANTNPLASGASSEISNKKSGPSTAIPTSNVVAVTGIPKVSEPLSSKTESHTASVAGHKSTKTANPKASTGAKTKSGLFSDSDSDDDIFANVPTIKKAAAVSAPSSAAVVNGAITSSVPSSSQPIAKQTTATKTLAVSKKANSSLFDESDDDLDIFKK